MKKTAGSQSKWLEIATFAGRAELDRLVPLFDKYGYGGTIIEEWPHDTGLKTYVAKIYLPLNRAAGRKKSLLLNEIRSANLVLRLEERVLEPGGWLNEWKRFFEPFDLGEKITIRPGWWETPLEKRGRLIIELDPGMAFGTGLHATTRLTYTGMEKHLKPGMSVLDLGTGSGILAVAAAKLGAAFVLAMDTDPVAVAAAAVNVIKNDVPEILVVKRGTLNTATCRRLKSSFDLVVANITADVITGLAPFFTKVLKPGAKLIAGGINQPGLDRVLIAFSLAGLKSQTITGENEWHAVVADKPIKAEQERFLEIGLHGGQSGKW
jgi:ribosomal protein L11 methyltransferase